VSRNPPPRCIPRHALVTKHQRGRERIVRGRIDAVRDVNRLLDELEAVWRERMQRFGDVLAQPDTEADRQIQPKGRAHR
jgi:hypothetical protein